MPEKPFKKLRTRADFQQQGFFLDTDIYKTYSEIKITSLKHLFPNIYKLEQHNCKYDSPRFLSYFVYINPSYPNFSDISCICSYNSCALCYIAKETRTKLH